MKKLFGFVAIMFAVMMFAACGGANTPGDVAKRAVKAMQNNDAEAFVDEIYSNAENGELRDDEREMVVSMFREKLSKQLEKDGGIKSFEITSEEISEDGNSATVKMNVTYGNGDTKEEKMKMKKDAKGNWKITLGK